MASEKIEKLIEEVKVLSVLELSELVHALEEEFGVSAAAAVAAAPAAGAAAGAADEQTEFNVVLAEVGASKMGVIKLVKDSAAGMISFPLCRYTPVSYNFIIKLLLILRDL